MRTFILLKNINAIQNLYDITPSTALANGAGSVNLDIEMETGTGKTYVYIKTMFELNKQYGWSKYIIVVPSIAIREGVAKSFNMLETTSWNTTERKHVGLYMTVRTFNSLTAFRQIQV